MHVNKSILSPTQVKLTISAEASELQPIKDEVVARHAGQVKVAGFRNGKAPSNIIEKNLDPAHLQSDFLDEALTQLYAKATVQEDIRPVTRPEVNIKKFVPFTDLEFEVTTNIIGELKLPDYKKIKVKKEPLSISSEDIQGVLDSLALRSAEKKSADRAIKKDDEAIIDFKGTDQKGNAVNGADATDYPLAIGSDTFIPGFEDNLIGMKEGENKSFTLTFPKDYGVSALANQKVTFDVTIKKVNEVVKPKIDDEFASKVGPFKTLGELKDDIKNQLTVEREREATSNQQNALLKAINEKTTVDLPEALIEQQITYNIDDLRRNLTYRGQTYEEYLKAEGKTEDELKTEMRPQAVDQIKASLILSTIAEKENITVEQEELNLQLQLLKGQYPDQSMQAELDKPENQSDIASRMLSEKVINYLISEE